MSAEVIEMSNQDKDRNIAIESAIGQIEKAFGKGSVMKLGTSGMNLDIQAISTGSLGLDVALGIGGLPKGRIVEIYGPESSGKTTLALHVVAEAQKEGIPKSNSCLQSHKCRGQLFKVAARSHRGKEFHHGY